MHCKKNIQDRISSAFCDYEGNLWFGTMGSGVQKFLGSHIKMYDTKSGLPSDDITVIYEDRFSNVWLGMRNGVSVISKNNVIPLEKYIPNIKEVRCFTEDSKGNIYIGTFDPMYGPTSLNQILAKQKIKVWTIPYGVASIFYNNENSIWISTYGGGTYKYSNDKFKLFTISDGLASNMIEKTINTNNAIWFLSRNNGASRYNNNIFNNYSKATGLPSNTIYDVYEDDKNIFLGTDEGLVQISENRITTYSTESGLLSKTVWAIFPSTDKTEFWIVTDKSLHKLKEDRIISLGNYTLIPSHDVSINNVYHRKGSSILWLATTEGAIRVDLSQIDFENYPPKVGIEEAYTDTTYFFNSINNSYYKSKDNITTLDYTQNDVTINFCALSFSDEEKIKYIYKMEGFDENWSEPTSEKNVRYRNLTPGKKTFKVFAINGNGIYSTQPAQITFIISSPFWETTWFLSIISIFFLSVLVGTIRFYSTRKLRIKIAKLEHDKQLREEKDKTRLQISRDLHDDISSTLGSIALYSESFKRQYPELSEQQKKMLDKISVLSSEAIDHMSDIIWSVAPEHDSLNDMLIRMKNHIVEQCSINRIEYEISVQEINENVSIDEEARRNIYLIFKEAMNNIIKHANATKINFSTKFCDNNFEMIIIDNGKGFDIDAGKFFKDKSTHALSGHGINNMKKRAEEINAEFTFQSSPGKGTKILLIKRMT
ncbi:MAG: ATP-binding protein [Melioribacteraceae bacterium]|nr:ATP-binding protein [Melioribacteraceae bacterium]